MPIYEYRCQKCGHELEAIQKISDSLLTQCPQCNTDSLVKKISASGFRLKGGGWYETDFKSGNKKNVSGAESTSSSDSSESGSSSSSTTSSESSSGGANSSDAKKEPKKKDSSSGSSGSKSSASD